MEKAIDEENGGWERKSSLYEKIGFGDISHKVDCRNIQFQ